MRHRRPGAPPRDRAPAPEERSLTDPIFLGSFPRADVALDPPLPEVAFVGRANAGKSSLLNAVTGVRLAKISGTPGKTRMLNVYTVSGAWGVGRGTAPLRSHAPHPTPDALYFLDLPGYGYSRAGKTDRTAFRRLVRHALSRVRLAGVVWLLDIRHEPSADDLTMQDLLAERETRALAALTKADKLPRGPRRRRERELRTTLGLPEDQVIVTSARTGEGIPELREAIAGLVQGAANAGG
jgi:GTP-binding protein